MEEQVNESLINLQKIADTFLELSLSYGPKLILALIVLILGFWFIRGLLKVANKAMEKSKVEPTLQRFLSSFAGVALKSILLIIFASMIGIEVASLIAVLGAAGLAVGLALQGSLSNLAGGVLILFFKPFKIGDIIEAQGHTGKVQDIQIFNTILVNYENEKIVIPNGILSNGCIKNIFCMPNRRIDIEFGISYGDDILKAREVIQKVVDANSSVLKDPANEILVSAHADSSIGILTRTWVNSDDYWPVYFYLYEEVKLAFDREGITIPFPQRDVHLFQQVNAS